jgi:hypothetical protein
MFKVETDPGYWKENPILDPRSWILVKAKTIQIPRLEIRDSRFVKAKLKLTHHILHFALFTFHFAFIIPADCLLPSSDCYNICP